MKIFNLKYLFLIYCFITHGIFTKSFYQITEKTIIKGTVVDSKTGDPLPYVSVILKNTTVGAATNNDGKYTIETTARASTISFSFLGYETETRPITPGKTQTINISLIPTSFALDEVVVKPAKRHYSNKNNPAVELIDKVIENKSKNRKEGFDYLQYEKYEKTQFALSNLPEDFKDRNAFRKFKFVFDNIDTTKLKGKEVLPLFIREALSNCYYRKTPIGNKEVVRAEKTINFEEYLDNKGVTANLNYLYQNINIYDNTILFLTNKFLSPVADGAPVFYRYYILDTLILNDIQCIKMYFDPRNKADFLFQGYLYITKDSTFAIKRIEMNINKKINIDWVKDVKIMQDFIQTQKNTWMLSKDEISIDFGITKGWLGLFGQRTVSYTNYSVNEPISDTIFRGPLIIDKLDPDEKTEDYWELNRHFPLSKTEKGIYTLVDSIKKVPAFRRNMDIIMLLTTEFLTFKKFEIGPVGSFYSYNPIEGSRARFGGRTTPGFSKKITFDGYLAYGFKDQQFKYSAGITYSLTPRTIYQFPVKSLAVSYQYDTKIPGTEFEYSQQDNILFSIKRGIVDKMLYNRIIKAEYFNEFENHFSYHLGYSFTRQAPGGNLHYNPVDYLSPGSDIPFIDIPEVFLDLRYAPNEAFYQGKLYRDPLPNKYPVMLLKYALGSKSIGNDYNYSRLQMSIYKRFYFSIIGYSDITLEAGKIFGQVPYPLLFIHRANQTYSYQRYSYNLMNFLEFVSDQYFSIYLDHSFNGFIFNKIPMLKRLKLREVVTCKVLYGGINDKNDPSLESGLFKFPTDNNSIPLTYTLSGKPYVEASVGVSNLFRIFRIDLIKRFTYIHNPDVSDLGIRIQIRLDI